jgi:hypothetical protein
VIHFPGILPLRPWRRPKNIMAFPINYLIILNSIIIKQPAHDLRRETMPKLTVLGALLMAGSLAFTGNIGMAKRVYAQSDSRKMTDQQYEELKQKRLKQYQELEQEDKDRANTAKRLQDAEKRRRDAEKRQRDAEQQMREFKK